MNEPRAEDRGGGFTKNYGHTNVSIYLQQRTWNTFLHILVTPKILQRR